MVFVSIVTTAYNRAYRLTKVYESLLTQTDKDFEWVVVDDGSTDNTKDLVTSFIEEKKIVIKYFFKENGGMHTAMNLGVSKAEGLFTLKLDSDDWLLENAIERVRYYYESELWKKGGKRELSGICFLNSDPEGNIIGDKFKEDLFVSDYISVRLVDRVRGDKSEVILTEKRKEVPYMVFPGEKRYPTSGVLITLAKKYDMIFTNESIYIRDYLADGISKSGRQKGYFSTPEGKIHHTNLFLTKEFNRKTRFKKAREYMSYGLYAKKNIYKHIQKSNAPFLVCFMFPRCFAGYIYNRFTERLKGRKR